VTAKSPKLPRGPSNPPGCGRDGPYSPPPAPLRQIAPGFQSRTRWVAPAVVAALRTASTRAVTCIRSTARRRRPWPAIFTCGRSSSFSATAPTKHQVSSTPISTMAGSGAAQALLCHVPLLLRSGGQHQGGGYAQPGWSSPRSAAGRHHAGNRAVILANPNNPTGTAGLLASSAFCARAQAAVCGRGLLRVLRRNGAGRDRTRAQSVS